MHDVSPFHTSNFMIFQVIRINLLHASRNSNHPINMFYSNGNDNLLRCKKNGRHNNFRVCVYRDKKITHIYNKHIHLIVKYKKKVHDNVNFDCLFVIQKYGYFSSNGKIQRKPFLIYTVVEITQHLKTVGNVLINST